MPEDVGHDQPLHSPVQPKAEQNSREPSLDSISSPGGPEQEGELDGPASPTAAANPPVQKRKGGRKPIYATSEERKQRNRQAQAAFRERRTEYIKQLETTIKHQDNTLQGLQQTHRSAADECLMLRYKNSLLERILLEKGIDVQSELKKKDTPLPGKVPPLVSNQTPIQRPIGRNLNRPGSGHQPLLQKATPNAANHSPHLQPSPSSRVSSPTVMRSPAYGMPMPGFKPQPLHIQPNLTPTSASSVASPTSAPGLQTIAPNPNPPGSAGHRPTHWPSPYQTHISQLEQEYEAPADMMDEEAEEHPAGPGPYPQQYSQSYASDAQSIYATSQAQSQPNIPHTQAEYQQEGGQFINPYDPLLEADPFGLTASMHFPTQFSFQESSMRK